MSRGRHETCPACGAYIWAPKGVLTNHRRLGSIEICEGSNQGITELANRYYQMLQQAQKDIRYHRERAEGLEETMRQLFPEWGWDEEDDGD